MNETKKYTKSNRVHDIFSSSRTAFYVSLDTLTRYSFLDFFTLLTFMLWKIKKQNSILSSKIQW